MKRFVLALFVFAALACPASALTCTFTIPTIAFGDVDTLLSSNTDTTGTLGINCTGGLTLSTVRVCAGFGTGSGGANATTRQMISGSSSLNYQLYQDPGRTVIWGSNTGNPVGTPNTIDVSLNALGNGSLNVPIYGRVFGSQSGAAVGSYQSNFTAAHTDFLYANVALLPCPGIIVLPQEAHPTFTVIARVVPHCDVTAQNLNFGTVGRLTANIDRASQITVTCTGGAAYSVGLSNGGGTGATPAARKMGNVVTYGLYRDGTYLQPWGNTIGTNTLAGTGNGGAQALTVYGRVPPQTTPATGTYTDTIQVVVTY